MQSRDPTGQSNQTPISRLIYRFHARRRRTALAHAKINHTLFGPSGFGGSSVKDVDFFFECWTSDATSWGSELLSPFTDDPDGQSSNLFLPGGDPRWILGFTFAASLIAANINSVAPPKIDALPSGGGSSQGTEPDSGQFTSIIGHLHNPRASSFVLRTLLVTPTTRKPRARHKFPAIRPPSQVQASTRARLLKLFFFWQSAGRFFAMRFVCFCFCFKKIKSLLVWEREHKLTTINHITCFDLNCVSVRLWVLRGHHQIFVSASLMHEIGHLTKSLYKCMCVLYKKKLFQNSRWPCGCPRGGDNTDVPARVSVWVCVCARHTH